ncbi:hypothetical protein [Dyella subtropica]|uniref:hypothetical protein n=1 Tax=Dyella subtropica TaxID=2992127 RepID=UPI00225B6045|nr:hypothetical protein [Dyella subtropica]
MNAEGRLRQQHARALLDSLHPAHCGDLPEPLLQQARQSGLGRRYLARTALRHAPSVFAPNHERWQLWQNAEPWLQWTQQRLHAFTLTLGGIALAPALRMIVERNAVLFVRSALGAENWRRAQSVDPWQGPAPEAVRHRGEALLQCCGRDALALAAEIHERGKIEFIGHAERRDENLAARLALAYASPPARPCSEACWLPASTVPMLLSMHDAEVST